MTPRAGATPIETLITPLTCFVAHAEGAQRRRIPIDRANYALAMASLMRLRKRSL